MKTKRRPICDNERCDYHAVLVALPHPNAAIAVPIVDQDGVEATVQSVASVNAQTHKSLRLCGTCMEAVGMAWRAMQDEPKEPEPVRCCGECD